MLPHSLSIFKTYVGMLRHMFKHMFKRICFRFVFSSKNTVTARNQSWSGLRHQAWFQYAFRRNIDCIDRDIETTDIFARSFRGGAPHNSRGVWGATASHPLPNIKNTKKCRYRKYQNASDTDRTDRNQACNWHSEPRIGPTCTARRDESDGGNEDVRKSVKTSENLQTWNHIT